MKKTIFALLFLAALGGAYFGGNSTAEQPATRGILKSNLTSTKVGVVNLVKVYSQSEQVKSLKNKIERELTPFKAKKEELDKLLSDWQTVLKNPDNKLNQRTRDRGRQIVIDCRRQLEDLELTFKKEVAGRLEKEMRQLTTEMNDFLQAYAVRHGFHLLMAYDEPPTALDAIKSFERNVSAIDKGQMQQVFTAGGVDVTREVVKALNDRFRAGEPVKNAEPR